MSKINIAKIMTPKACTRILHESNTVRQALEIMSFHGYTALPVLDSKERYLGCISEGDFLRHIMKKGTTDLKFHEQFLVGDIVRKDVYQSVRITDSDEEIIRKITNQNFLPVVDDRNVLCGIITRRGVILELSDYE